MCCRVFTFGLHFIMRIVLLLALLSVSLCSSRVYVVPSGSDVTLNCTYDIKTHGALEVCWGRGNLPNSGCNNQLIYTDGYKVTGRASERYQLRGRLDRGDVSLTIFDVTEDNSGKYGCRVEIPGPFNDEKHYMDLKVETATSAPTTTSSHTETPTWPTTANQTTGHMTSTGANILTTSPFSDVQETEEVSTLVVVLMCVLFGSVVVVAALVVLARRCQRIDKIVQQQGGTSVRFTSTSSTLHLHSRGSAVENVYQLDEGGDRGGDYEYCP